MRLVIQSVLNASVTVAGKKVSEIGEGFLILFGAAQGDTKENAAYLAKKTANLRIFADKQGKMNLSLLDTGREALVVSQFTLYGDCKKGNRPAFVEALEPKEADELYQYYIEQLKSYAVPVKAGVFQAEMQVALINNGPVTIIMER